MRKPLLIALAAALVLIPAVGLAAALVDGDVPPIVPEANQEYLDEAAAEMNLSPQQATEILEQARELRMRMNANRLGLSFEEMQERMTERFQNRGQGRHGRLFQGQGPCR